MSKMSGESYHRIVVLLGVIISTILLTILAGQEPAQAQSPATPYDITKQCFAVADERAPGNTADDALVRLNRTNGQTTVIGLTGTQGIEAIAFGPMGVLYATNGGQLGTLNLNTAAFTAKPQPIGSGNGAQGVVTFKDADGLFYDIANDLLWAVERVGSKPDLLFRIDPATGALIANAFGPGKDYVEIQPTTSGGKTLSDLDDIAIDPVDDILFGAANSGGSGGVLVIINRTTGTTTPVGQFRYPNPYPTNPALAGQVVDDVEGLSFFNDGQLYGSTGDNGPDNNDKNQLFILDKNSALATRVGAFPTGHMDYEGLACLTAPAFISLRKYTNGEDADTPTGPVVPPGSQVTWTYIITNTGSITLTDLILTDDKVGLIGPDGSSNCPPPGTILGPGDSLTCTATGIAQVGQYANIGIITGTTQIGVVFPRQTVAATNPSHYFGNGPAIAIKKYTNGEDADTPTGPFIPPGGAVTWSYVVTNTGNVVLNPVNVTDDQGVVVNCPKNVLQPQESMTCTGSGVAVAGQYANIGTVTGIPPAGPPVTSTDPSHYFGAAPAIVIKKYTNGEDADTPTGPKIPIGGAVTWTYIVTNTGNVTLAQVNVTDDKGVVVTCPKTVLLPQESMTCTGAGVAVAGQYVNIGAVIGTPPVGPPVTSTDPSHYFGYQPASVGNLVFGDIDPNGETPAAIEGGNGVQDSGEIGIDGIIVQLYEATTNTLISETVTSNGGHYLFPNLPPGEYYLVFINPLPEGVWTMPNVGSNDTIDSDPISDPAVTDPRGEAQKTDPFILTSGQVDLSWDAGLVGLSSTASANVGDFVWFDLNKNGIQDSGENGFPGVTVRLFNADSNTLIRTTQTGANGKYLFSGVDPGNYYIEFVIPPNFTISPQNATADDEKDSDIDPNTKRTTVFALPSFVTDLRWDAGIFQAGTSLEPDQEPGAIRSFLPLIRSK